MNDYNPAVGLPEGVDSVWLVRLNDCLTHPAELALRGGHGCWLGSLSSGAASIPGRRVVGCISVPAVVGTMTMTMAMRGVHPIRSTCEAPP